PCGSRPWAATPSPACCGRSAGTSSSSPPRAGAPPTWPWARWPRWPSNRRRRAERRVGHGRWDATRPSVGSATVSGRQVLRVVAGLALLVAVACGGESGEGAGDDAARAGTSTPAAGEPGRTATTTTGEANTTTPSTAPASPPPTRPDWLGTRVLSPGGPHPTPPELDPRRLPTVDVLPPPDGGFHATIEPVPPEVAARSTWQPDCPVALEDLRYVTVTFWGFDD